MARHAAISSARVEAVGERLVEVALRDLLAAGQVGDRAGHPQHPVVASSAEVQTVARGKQPRGEGRVERHERSGEASVHVSVAERRCAAEPLTLALAGSHHPLAHLLRARTRLTLVDQLQRRHLLHLADQVDAIQHRAGEAAPVAGSLEPGAGAVALRTRAGTVVAGGHHGGVGREAQRALAARDLDGPLLERLAQRVDRVAGELRELVEKQHAPVGQRDLARARPAAATDEALRRDRVMRSAEGSFRGEEPVADPGRAVDLGDLERFVEARRRQDAGQAPGEHRLAHTGRADHQHVVAAGRGDLERPLGVRLAADIGQVQRLGGPVGVGARMGRLAPPRGPSCHAAGPPAAPGWGCRAPRPHRPARPRRRCAPARAGPGSRPAAPRARRRGRRGRA